MNKQIVSIYIQENYGDKLTGAQKKLKKEQPRIYNAIYDYTDYMPKSSSFTERCYNVKAGLSKRATCSCGKKLKFKSYKNGYGSTGKCSKACKG
jgi:hypothetical protein